MIAKFTTFFIIKALGIPRERLQDWMNRGFITPTIAAKGKGSKALFTLDDVYGIAFFQSLLRKGLNRGVAAGIVQEFLRLDDPKIISYVLLRYETASGGPQSIMPFQEKNPESSDGHWSLDLATGTCRSDFLVEPLRENYDWDGILILNFRSIKKGVDTKLEAIR
jgi:hypothetical protein